MTIKLKQYGEMTYTADGEENGEELKGYKLVEIPEEVLHFAIDEVLNEEFGIYGTAEFDKMFDKLGIWDQVEDAMEELYPEQIKEVIEDNYSLEDIERINNNVDKKSR